MIIKFKDFFAIKYRISPVYDKGTKYGYIVYEKHWYDPTWLHSQLDQIEPAVKSKSFLTDALFKTVDECNEYIKFKRTVY